MVDRYEAVERFAKLRAEGVISEDEFAAEKAKLLGAAGAEPDFATMRPATVVEPVRRSRWPMWVGGGVLLVLASAVGLLLATRPNSSAPSSAATPKIAHAPPCNSVEAHDLLTKAVAAGGGQLASMTGPAESGFDAARGSRTCTADLMLAGSSKRQRTFRLLVGGDGQDRAELTADAATPPAAAKPETGQAFEAGADHGDLIDPAALDIEITDDDQTYSCCLKIGDVLQFFSTGGGSAFPTEPSDRIVDVHVHDPAGRWNGWTDMVLEFYRRFPQGEPSFDSITVAGKVVSSPEPGPTNPNALLRQSFRLHDSDAPGEDQ